MTFNGPQYFKVSKALETIDGQLCNLQGKVTVC